MKTIWRALLLLLCLRLVSVAHDGLELGPPTSESDAWNMLNLCRANLDALVRQRQIPEVPVQASFCIQSLRYLREHAGDAHQALMPKFFEAEDKARFLYRIAEQQDALRTPKEVKILEAMIDGIGTAYDPAVRNAIVYSCPMCRGVRELDPKKSCFKCGMALVPRVIPASSIYNTPGEPSVVLTPVLEHPLTAGAPATVKIRFARKKDHAPVTLAELLVVHTRPIHLLIVDESLQDYHHEHPTPTEVPGEYAFTFTPRQPGSYRVFADIVPALSNVQEYAMCDLPGEGVGEPVQRVPDRFVTDVDGLRYSVTWENIPLGFKVAQPVRGKVTITDAATGQPFTQLEPIMGTYAHIVGFFEDRRTVIHIHPTSGAPRQSSDRGGPSFTFQFFAPRPGYCRLYVQTQIDGASHFAPIDVNVGR